MSIGEADDFFADIDLPAHAALVVDRVLEEILGGENGLVHFFALECGLVVFCFLASLIMAASF